MKKINRKLIAGTAMVATAAALSACGLNPTVYGPPPISDPEVTIEDIDIGPEEDVYGPPEYFDETEADDSVTEPEPPVYGPPAGDQSPVQP
ncbi:MAG: hypothetical protein J6S31_01325 [Lachnospiraceae bacterium]|nr:hypothetical protein [Lachnospiraceae bacterium]